MTQTTKTFEIVNTTSGHSFGLYQGEDEDAAIASMMEEAGSSEPVSDDIKAIKRD